MNNEVIQKQIKEAENGLAELLSHAMEISPDRLGIIQQRAIRSFQSAIRDIQGIHLGELKNAFGIGVEQPKITDEDEDQRKEIEALSKTG